MYSEVVDSVLQLSGALEQSASVKRYVNMTIRELCTPVFFHRNLVEDTLVTNGSNPYIWERPLRLQKLQTIMAEDGEFPPYIMPGKAQKDKDFYYYAASTYYAVKGATGNLHVAYFQFPKRLEYYASAVRPAVYDFETEEWTYLPAFDVNDTTRANARELVSNWLLQDYKDLVEEGTLAKMFRLRSDDFRASTHYALFEKLKADFYAAEPHTDMAA